MARIKLDHCVVNVSDWARSNSFYQEVLSAELAPMRAGWAYRFGSEQLHVPVCTGWRSVGPCRRLEDW